MTSRETIMTIYVPVDVYDDPYEGYEKICKFGFVERTDAEHYIKTHKASNEWEIYPIIIYQEYPDDGTIERDRLRSEALNKLTKEEIHALGL